MNEIKSIPYAPMSHPFIERVIGTIRREYLDDVPFWNSLDLARKLDQFQDYYNNHRTHDAHSGQSPTTFTQTREQPHVDITDFGWQQHCYGAMVCFKRRYLLDYQFAMHRLNAVSR